MEKQIEACKFGSRIHDISRAVSGVINKKYGIVTDYCGHGVGLAVHEDPAVPNDLVGGSNPRLQEGMVLAIEPMITLGKRNILIENDGWTARTIDRKPAAHYELSVCVRNGKADILSTFDYIQEVLGDKFI